MFVQHTNAGAAKNSNHFGWPLGTHPIIVDTLVHFPTAALTTPPRIGVARQVSGASDDARDGLDFARAAETCVGKCEHTRNVVRAQRKWLNLLSGQKSSEMKCIRKPNDTKDTFSPTLVPYLIVLFQLKLTLTLE